MLLLRQLKPLRLSTWRQRQSFADRIKNKYLLPGNYPFRPLHLIWRLGNHNANPLPSGPVNINLKLLLEQMRSVSRSYDGKLSRLPLAITGKSRIQALSSSNHNKVFEQGYRNQLKSTWGSKPSHNPSGFQQNYSMVGKNSPAAFLPNLLQSYPGFNTDQRRETSLSQSPMNRINQKNNHLWQSSHIEMTPPEKTGRKPISTQKLSGFRRLDFSLTIPVRKAQSRQRLKREGLVLGEGEMLNAQAVKKIALGQRVIVQPARKGQKSANNTVLRRWSAIQSKSGDAISPHSDSRTIMYKNQYRLITRSVAGVNRTYGLNIFSKLNDLMTGLPSDMGLEAKSSWPIKLNYAITSPNRSIPANALAASKNFPGQAMDRFINHYVQRQNQVLRRRKTDFYQAKQRPALLSRPLISEKTGLDLIKKQVSLLPVGLLMSKRTNLEQAKQAERSHNHALSAAQSRSLDARIKVQNKTGMTQLNSYPDSQSIQISRYSMIGTSKGRLGKQLGSNLSNVKGNGTAYYYGVPSYDGGSLRSIALQYLHRGFIKDLSKQQSGNIRNVLAVNHTMRNIYLDGGRNSFYPALPLAAGPGARGVKLPWQNRVKTVRGNIRGYDNATFRSLVRDTGKAVRVDQRVNLADGYLPALSQILFVTKNILLHKESEIKQARLSKSAWPGYRQRKSDRLRHYTLGLNSRVVRRTRTEDLKGKQAFDQNKNDYKGLAITGSKKQGFAEFIFHKMAMASVGEGGPNLFGHQAVDKLQVQELQSRARNRVGRTSIGLVDEVLPLVRKTNKSGKYRGYEKEKIHPGSSYLSIIPFTKLISSSIGTNNRTKDFPDIFRPKLLADYEKSSLTFLAPSRLATKMYQSAARSTNNSLGMPSRSREINSSIGTNNRTKDFPDIFRPKLLADYEKSSLTFLAPSRLATKMHQSAARNTNNSLAMPSRSRDMKSAQDRGKSGASNLINRSTGMRSKKHSYTDYIYIKTAMASAAGDGPSRFGHQAMANLKVIKLQIRARKRVEGRMSSRVAGEVLPLVRNSDKLSKGRGYEDPKILFGGKSPTLVPFAQLISSSVGAINSGTNSFPNVFRPILMADSGKSSLSFSAPGSLAMIMRKATAGSINNFLAVPKRSGDINYDRGRANLEALSPANRNKGIRDFKLGLIMKNMLKNYREKQTKSGWLQKWFVNKKPSLLKTPNARENFIELASNWGSLRAGSKLPTHQRLSVKEPKHRLVSPMKILPFTKSTSSSREVSPNWQTIGHYITRSSKPSDRWLNRYMDHSRVSRIKTRAVIFNKKRSSQAPLDRNITGANKTLISGDKTRLPVNYSDPNLIPYRGIKTGDDKRLPSYSLLASGPDLNHRRDTSSAASNYLDSAIDTKAKAITKELKMQITETRNPEIKNTEIKRIADRVYQEIQQRMKLERQRRGL